MSKFSFGRRSLILGGAATALGAYAYHRGLRYPRMGFEPKPLAKSIEFQYGKIEFVDAVALGETALSRISPRLLNQLNPAATIPFRAIAPEPIVNLQTERGQLQLLMNNVAANAELRISGKGIRRIDEQTKGINRLVNIDTGTAQEFTLSWHLPSEDGFKFAVIGDTGGNAELNWSLQRANALDAQFLLHLGDFNYGNDDYNSAIEQFHNAPLPCYISIGNHDFNDSGLVYDKFRQQLGQFNHSFEVLGTRFVNLDTAADFFPVNAGMRGQLIQKLIEAPKDNQIFFTHRPLRDPRPGKDHNVGSLNGVDWISQQIKSCGGGTLLAGHVHHSTELDINGLCQYTVGEGLGHEDILLKRQVAQILVGTVQRGAPVKLNWANLNMPWPAHKSHTHQKKLLRRGDRALINWFNSIHA